MDNHDCILFATADWDAPYWTNKQHTACHLANLGLRVLYVESMGLRPPSINRKDIHRIWQRLKKGFKSPHAAQHNIWVFSPLIIPFKHHSPWIRKINQGLLSWQLKCFCKKNHFKHLLIWTYHPFILQTIQKIPYDKLIYHCVDDLTAVPGVDASAFLREERQLLTRAHAVFTTSEHLQKHCVSVNPRTYYFSNVADIQHFQKALQKNELPEELAVIPKPRIGYIGALSDFKIDFALILAIAKDFPMWHWVLIGDEHPGQKNEVVAELRTLCNVHFLGHRPYLLLPDYLGGMDVATLPSLINSYTDAMFPMKYFEYLAAGLPIVSTPLQFTNYAKAGLEIGERAEEFALAIKKQLARGRLTEKEINEFVADNTWDARLKKMLEKAEIVI